MKSIQSQKKSTHSNKNCAFVIAFCISKGGSDKIESIEGDRKKLFFFLNKML